VKTLSQHEIYAKYSTVVWAALERDEAETFRKANPDIEPKVVTDFVRGQRELHFEMFESYLLRSQKQGKWQDIAIQRVLDNLREKKNEQ